MPTPPKKPIPHHAYSFSAAILLTIATTATSYFSNNRYLTTTMAIATAGCFAHAFHDLHKENRLRKAFSPVVNFFKRNVMGIAQQQPVENRTLLRAN